MGPVGENVRQEREAGTVLHPVGENVRQRARGGTHSGGRVLRVATFNVNGIRAASRRGFDRWLAGRGCDVVGLQEVRCPADDLPEAFGDYVVTYFAGNLAGRNGVAILSRSEPTAVRYGFESRTFDAEGRYVEVDLDLGEGRPPVTVGSLYLPKGGAPTQGPDELRRYRRKLRFLASYGRYLTRARRAAAAAGREFLVMGDFNIAHTSLDVTNWRSSRQSAGFLPEERDWFGSILGPRTLVDGPHCGDRGDGQGDQL